MMVFGRLIYGYDSGWSDDQSLWLAIAAAAGLHLPLLACSLPVILPNSTLSVALLGNSHLRDMTW